MNKIDSEKRKKRKLRDHVKRGKSFKHKLSKERWN